MHAAVKKASIEDVRMIIANEGRKALSQLDSSNQLPIHIAAYYNHVEILTLLCQLRSDVSARDKNGYTPLLSAAAQGSFACMEALLRAKASPMDQSPEGSSALHFVVRHAVSLEQKELFLRIIGMITAAGVSIDVRNAQGETPLHQAAVRNRWFAVRSLINLGAAVNAVTKLKDTPLHYAATGHVDSFRELIRRGADPDLVGQFGTVTSMVENIKQQGQTRTELLEILNARSTMLVTSVDAEDAVETARAKILLEILQTERSYATSLGILTGAYLSQLRERALLTAAELTAIFSEVEAIADFSKRLLAELEERLSNVTEQLRAGDLFIYVSTRAFASYNTYVNNYDAAMAAVGKLRKRGGKIAAFLEEVKARPECKRLDLEALLIMPVQRIPRYVLLLRDLLRATPASHRDYTVLRDALDRLQATAEQINARKREAENAAPVARIAESLAMRLKFPLVRAYRHLRREGKLIRIADHVSGSSAGSAAVVVGSASAAAAAGTPVKAFLFNDILLLAPSKKAKTPAAILVLPLERVLVLPAPPAESCNIYVEYREETASSADNKTSDLVTDSPVVVYRLAASTPELRNEWAKDLATAAAEWGALHVECTPVERLGDAPPPLAACVAWQAPADTSKPRSKGALHLFGGYDASKVHASGYILDLGTRLWSEMTLSPPLPTARSGAAVATLPDGRVYIHGGRSSPTSCLSELFLWNPSNPSLLSPVSLYSSSDQPPARASHSLVYLSALNALVLLGGTADGTTPAESIHICSFRSTTKEAIWKRLSPTGDHIPPPRIEACAAPLPTGVSLVYFGGVINGAAASASELFILTLTTSSPSASASSRSIPSATWRRMDAAGPSAPSRAIGPYSVTNDPPALYLISEAMLAAGLDNRAFLFRLDLQLTPSRGASSIWERALIDGSIGNVTQSTGSIDLLSSSFFAIGGLAPGGKYSSDVNRISLTRVAPARSAQGRDEDLKEAAAANVGSSLGVPTSSSSSVSSMLSVPTNKGESSSSDSRRGSVKSADERRGSSVKSDEAGSRIHRKVKVAATGVSGTDSSSSISTSAPELVVAPLPTPVAALLNGPDPFQGDAPHLINPPAASPTAITHATFNKIVEKLIDAAGDVTPPLPAFVDEIIVGHRLMGSSVDMLALILYHHRSAVTSSTSSDNKLRMQAKCVALLKRWIARVPSDWAEPSALYSLLERYVAACDTDVANMSSILKEAKAAMPPPELPGALGKTTSLVLTKCDVDELAKQLCLLDAAFVRSLPLYELVDPFAPDARRLQATLGWYKRLFLWTVHEVVTPLSVDDRVNSLDRAIRLAARLRTLGSGLAVLFLLALRSAPVARLRNTWRRIPSRAADTINDMLQQLPRTTTMGGSGLASSVLYFLADSADLAASAGRASCSSKSPRGTSHTLWNITRVRALAKIVLQLTDAIVSHPGTIDKAAQDALLAGSPPPPPLASSIETSLLREPPSNERLPRFGRPSPIITIAPFLADLYPLPPLLQERDWRVLLCRARVASFVQGDVLTKDGRWPGGYLLRVRTGSVSLGDSKSDTKLLVLPQQLLHLESLLQGANIPGPPIIATAAAQRVELWQLEPSFIASLGLHKPRLVLRLYRSLTYLLSQRLAGVPMATRAGKAYETSLEVDGDAERHAEWEDDGASRESLALTPTDAILKRFPCVLRGSMKDEPGTLLVSAAGVHFVNKSKAKKFSMQWHELSALEGSPPELTIVTGKRKFALRDLRRDPRPLMHFLSGENSVLSPSAPSNSRERLTAALSEAMEKNNDNNNNKAASSSSLTRKEWKQVCQGGRKVRLSSGDVVAREGERSTVYRIRRGVVRVERGGFVLGSLEEGHSFGEAALFGLPSPATFVVQDNAQLVECDYLFLAALPETNAPLALRLYQQLSLSLFPLVGRLPSPPAVAQGGAGVASKPGLRPQRLVSRIADPTAIVRADTRSLRRISTSSSSDLVPNGTRSRTLSEVKVSPRPEHRP